MTSEEENIRKNLADSDARAAADDAKYRENIRRTFEAIEREVPNIPGYDSTPGAMNLLIHEDGKMKFVQAFPCS